MAKLSIAFYVIATVCVVFADTVFANAGAGPQRLSLSSLGLTLFN